MMLLKMHLPNNSATSGFVWEEFDFEACNSFAGRKYTWATLTLLCFAFGFPASIAILWEMFKRHRRGTSLTSNDFFIVNLTTMDFAFLAFIPPGLLNHLIWKRWVLEATWNFFYALNITGRPLMMACICLDCYLAVVHPITYHKRKSLTPRIVMAGIVWAVTFATGIAYFLYYKLFFSIFSTVPLTVTIVIIVICDSSIIHVLLKSDPSRRNVQKQRALQTLINSLVITVLSYMPPIFLIAIGMPLSSTFTNFICVIGIPLTISAALGSAVMPILHLLTLNNNRSLGCCRL